MAKILLVDDDLDIMSAYSEIIQKKGHRVVEAKDVADARVKLRNEQFDVIITDLKMPKVHGGKLVEEVLQSDAHKGCPVIISSGFIENDVIEKFRSIGQIHFLPKPVSPTEILEKIDAVLNRANRNTAVDVRFINPILQSTVSALKDLTGAQFAPSKPVAKKSGEIAGDISGIVGVVSAGFKGSISISFAEKAFLTVVSKMLQIEFTVIDESNKDAVAEILNIIFGRAKKMLNEGGMNIQSAIPSIVVGKAHQVGHHSELPTIVINFDSAEVGKCRLEICAMS